MESNEASTVVYIKFETELLFCYFWNFSLVIGCAGVYEAELACVFEKGSDVAYQAINLASPYYMSKKTTSFACLSCSLSVAASWSFISAEILFAMRFLSLTCQGHIITNHVFFCLERAIIYICLLALLVNVFNVRFKNHLAWTWGRSWRLLMKIRLERPNNSWDTWRG